MWHCWVYAHVFAKKSQIRLGWDDWDKLDSQTCRVDPSRSIAPMQQCPQEAWRAAELAAGLPSLRIAVLAVDVARLVRRVRGGGREFPRHHPRVDDELVAVGGEDGERDAERDGALGAVLITGADQGDDGRPAVIGEPEEPGLVLDRRADQDAVPVPALPQAESA